MQVRNPWFLHADAAINALIYALEYNSYEGPFVLSEDFERRMECCAGSWAMKTITS